MDSYSKIKRLFSLTRHNFKLFVKPYIICVLSRQTKNTYADSDIHFVLD